MNNFLQRITVNFLAQNWVKKTLIILSIIGPGLITANLDNDAGGIATYSLAGAHTGYRLLWVFLPITISLIFVQEMSARMGVVSGKGLADLIREKFGLKVTFYLLFFLIFADLANTMAEFAGIASAGEIFGLSKYISVPLSALFVWLLVLKGDYKLVERVFLLGCTVFLSYIISGFFIKPDWNDIIISTITPNIESIKIDDFPIIVGLIGTTITPWMQFYLQAAVVEKGITPKHLFESRIDVIIGCLFMFIVTLFIVISCAATLYKESIHIHTAADAAIALAPLAGPYASYLFALGLLNASLFAAAILPLATSYYVCEGMGWESGINKNFKDAPNFFSIFTFLIVISALAILIPEVNLFKILIGSQIINGTLIPIVILYMIQLCNDPEVMGEFTNGPAQNFLSYCIVFAMFAANAFMLYYEFFD